MNANYRLIVSIRVMISGEHALSLSSYKVSHALSQQTLIVVLGNSFTQMCDYAYALLGYITNAGYGCKGISRIDFAAFISIYCKRRLSLVGVLLSQIFRCSMRVGSRVIAKKASK